MKWISVEDRYPPTHTTVIITGGCGYWTGDHWCTHLESNCRGNDATIQWEVTHWMTLPKLNKG